MIFYTASLVKVFGLTQLHSSVCLCTTFFLFVLRPRSMYNSMLPPLSLVSVFTVYNVLMRTKLQWKPVVNCVNSLAADVAGVFHLYVYLSKGPCCIRKALTATEHYRVLQSAL